jgi:hypothetical protein
MSIRTSSRCESDPEAGTTVSAADRDLSRRPAKKSVATIGAQGSGQSQELSQRGAAPRADCPERCTAGQDRRQEARSAQARPVGSDIPSKAEVQAILDVAGGRCACSSSLPCSPGCAGPSPPGRCRSECKVVQVRQRAPTCGARPVPLIRRRRARDSVAHHQCAPGMAPGMSEGRAQARLSQRKAMSRALPAAAFMRSSDAPALPNRRRTRTAS